MSHSNPPPPKSVSGKFVKDNTVSVKKLADSLSQDDFRQILMTPRAVSHVRKPVRPPVASLETSAVRNPPPPTISGVKAPTALPPQPSYKDVLPTSLSTSTQIPNDDTDWVSTMRHQVLQRKEEILKLHQHPNAPPVTTIAESTSVPQQDVLSNGHHPVNVTKIGESTILPTDIPTVTFRSELAKKVYTFCIDHKGMPPFLVDPSLSFHKDKTLLIYHLMNGTGSTRGLLLLPHIIENVTKSNGAITTQREDFVIQHSVKFFQSLRKQKLHLSILRQSTLASATPVDGKQSIKEANDDDDDDIFPTAGNYVAPVKMKSEPSILTSDQYQQKESTDDRISHIADDLLNNIMKSSTTNKRPSSDDKDNGSGMDDNGDMTLLKSLRDKTRSLRESFPEMEKEQSKNQQDSKTKLQLTQLTQILQSKYNMTIKPSTETSDPQKKKKKRENPVNK